MIKTILPHTDKPSWYRGPDPTFYPKKPKLIEETETNAIEKYVLSGWLPEKPFIDKNITITSFGSCFAYHISKHLKAQGYDLSNTNLDLTDGVIHFGEGLVNTFVILQQLKWALEDKSTHIKLLDLIRKTDVFIITLGLSEIWWNKQTNEPMWKAPPKDDHDLDIHDFKTTTSQENYDNLWKIHDLIRITRPNAYLIFTLSPIPLIATFRPISCITANVISKSILRAALDQIFCNIKDDKLYYFPSYEIVKEFFIDPYKNDNRHLKDEVLNTIMEIFKKYYCI